MVLWPAVLVPILREARRQLPPRQIRFNAGGAARLHRSFPPHPRDNDLAISLVSSGLPTTVHPKMTPAMSVVARSSKAELIEVNLTAGYAE
jgi:hypothetical protein